MRYLVTVLVVLCFASSALATDYHGNCTVAFTGSSTLHDFHGKGKCEPFIVSTTDGVFDMSKPAVAVAGMDTANPKRDKKMHEMFDQKNFPLITANAGAVNLKDFRKKAGESPKVNFKLKIRDIVKPVTGTVSNFVETDSRITADVAFTVSLADYQLKPPSVLGVIKVDDKISVTTSFVITK